MKYRALYRETRPEVFGEILGQDSIVKILKHQVATGKVSHAYLFTGTRGTGKTTTARILAKAVNCTCGDPERTPCGECDNCKAIAAGTFVDVVEIDAASNNGVENIRELRESVNYPPAVGKTKVYIIDEVHMLSTGAFNALLKTLEEPPENVIFILATTNPEKLPSTVLSRCMRLDFRRVSGELLAGHMEEICRSHGVTASKDALALLAANADGSVRDSLSILEQCLSSGEQDLTRDMVLDFLGAVSDEFYLKLTDLVTGGQISDAFVLLDKALSEGKDVKQIMKDFMGHLRNLLIAKFVKDPRDMLSMSDENIEKIRAQAAGLDAATIDRAIVTVAKAINDARYSTQARVLMEVALVSIAEGAEYGKGLEPGGGQLKQASGQTSGQRHEAQVSGAAPAGAKVQGASDQKQEPADAQAQSDSEQRRESPAEATAAQEGPVIQTYADEADDDSGQEAMPGDEAPAIDAAVDVAPAEVPADDEEPAGEVAGGKGIVRDIASVWNDICMEAAEKMPVLNILKDMVPAEPKGGEVKLITDLGIQKDVIDKNRELINSVLKKNGVDAHIVCVLSEAAGAPASDAGEGSEESAGNDDEPGEISPELEKAKQAISDKFGIEAKIK